MKIKNLFHKHDWLRYSIEDDEGIKVYHKCSKCGCKHFEYQLWIVSGVIIDMFDGNEIILFNNITEKYESFGVTTDTYYSKKIGDTVKLYQKEWGMDIFHTGE